MGNSILLWNFLLYLRMKENIFNKVDYIKDNMLIYGKEAEGGEDSKFNLGELYVS